MANTRSAFKPGDPIRLSTSFVKSTQDHERAFWQGVVISADSPGPGATAKVQWSHMPEGEHKLIMLTNLAIDPNAKRTRQMELPMTPTITRQCRLLKDVQGALLEVSNADIASLGVTRQLGADSRMTPTTSYLGQADAKVFLEAAGRAGWTVEQQPTEPSPMRMSVLPWPQRGFPSYQPEWVDDPLKLGSVTYMLDGRRATMLGEMDGVFKFSVEKQHWVTTQKEDLPAEVSAKLDSLKKGDHFEWRGGRARFEELSGDRVTITYSSPVEISLRSDQVCSTLSVTKPPKLEPSHKSQTLTHHSDAGHGWLAVAIEDLRALNIQHEISPYSYMSATKAYLEEDVDADRYISAAKSAGWSIKVKHHTANHSSIRGYGGYKADFVDQPIEVGRTFRLLASGALLTVNSYDSSSAKFTVTNHEGTQMLMRSTIASECIGTEGLWQKRCRDSELEQQQLREKEQQRQQATRTQAPSTSL